MRPIIKKDRVCLGDAPAKAPRPARALRAEDASAEPPPAVRLVRVEGVVRALEVRCSCCGDVTVVELEYGG